MDAGDIILQEHLSTASGNATYTSSNTQNQLIDIIHTQIQHKILHEVRRAKWFTVIADKVTDVSNKELLSIVLRYIDQDTGLAREDFVSFLECDTGISGHSLAEKITTTLQYYGLDLMKLRGQAYDGAGNMAGSIRGTAALISAQYPLALYLHCASHCLNLAVVKSLQIASVRNMMGVVDRVYVFFAAHPKHQGALDNSIAECQSQSSVKKSKDLCRTQVQQIDALHIFQSLHVSIVTCLEGICNAGPRMWSSDSVTDARSLQLAVSTTDFIASLVIQLLPEVPAINDNQSAGRS